MINVVAEIIYRDDVTLLEHEDCRWITIEEKDDFKFAGADVKVFEMIQIYSAESC